ncbi:MAG: hypothetical protein FJ403_13340 [Verrucomicrobia bacterium]|nr:hypothetical protein [Verrucomicrobiota bacterium]
MRPFRFTYNAALPWDRPWRARRAGLLGADEFHFLRAKRGLVPHLGQVPEMTPDSGREDHPLHRTTAARGDQPAPCFGGQVEKILWHRELCLAAEG